MSVCVFYRLEAINLSAMLESFVLKYFTKLLQFGLTGTCWDTHSHKYVTKQHIHSHLKIVFFS